MANLECCGGFAATEAIHQPAPGGSQPVALQRRPALSMAPGQVYHALFVLQKQTA